MHMHISYMCAQKHKMCLYPNVHVQIGLCLVQNELLKLNTCVCVQAQVYADERICITFVTITATQHRKTLQCSKIHLAYIRKNVSSLPYTFLITVLKFCLNITRELLDISVPISSCDSSCESSCNSGLVSPSLALNNSFILAALDTSAC